MADVEKVDDVEVVTDNGTVVKVVEAKEGIMTKIKNHKKVVIGAAVAGAALVGYKLLKMFRSSGEDDQADTEFDEYDDNFDSDSDDSTETAADAE